MPEGRGGPAGLILRVGAALASGALLAAAFPPLDWGVVALVALVPLLLAVETIRPRTAALLGYVAGLTFFGLHLLWIAQFLSWTGAVAWLAWGALSGIQAIFVAAFVALVPATRPLGAWRLLVLPACWAVLELVRAHHPLGGFPWGLLATSQHDAGPLLPLARVVGGFGLAAAIVAANLAVAFWLRVLWSGAQEGSKLRRPEGSGEPQGGAPVGREGSGEPQGGAPVNREVVVWTDGGARGNPGPAGYGAVVTTPGGQVLAEVAEGIGWATNNVAEYQGVIAGLRRAKELGARRVRVRADSLLVVNQQKGLWKVKNAALRPLADESARLAREFDRVTWEHVPRERNRRADALANRAMDDQGRVARPPEGTHDPEQLRLS
jgi:ribonuclease HI